MEGAARGTAGAPGACRCRDVSKTLGSIQQPLLRIGSTFKGFDTDPIRSTAWGARLQRATLTYTDPMLDVARHASAKFARNRNYVALHLRGGDGEFRRRFHQTVRNAFKSSLRRTSRGGRRRRRPKYYQFLYMLRRTRPIEARENLGRAWRA